MKTFAVFARVIGEEWERVLLPDGTSETSDLAIAMGLADTIKSPIRQAMVASITTDREAWGGRQVIRKTFELIE